MIRNRARQFFAARRNIRGRSRFGAEELTSNQRGRGFVTSKKVRIGIVGVGNCASSLVQGLSY
ncbi:MAG: hypothetical protein E5V86_28335, partial [Mesorhizobium sp.]